MVVLHIVIRGVTIFDGVKMLKKIDIVSLAVDIMSSNVGQKCFPPGLKCVEVGFPLGLNCFEDVIVSSCGGSLPVVAML